MKLPIIIPILIIVLKANGAISASISGSTNDNPAVGSSDLDVYGDMRSYLGEDIDREERFEVAGVFDFIKKGKDKTIGMILKLKEILSLLNKIQKISGKASFSNDKRSITDNEMVEHLLTKVFITLKDSGLINSVIKMSLTDDEVRPMIEKITIELIKADVIPYEEVFEALNQSGLAIDILKFSVTDPETRQGVIDLVIEMIPQLISSGAIDLEDILKSLPKPSLPSIDDLKKLPKPGVPSLEELREILGPLLSEPPIHSTTTFMEVPVATSLLVNPIQTAGPVASVPAAHFGDSIEDNARLVELIKELMKTAPRNTTVHKLLNSTVPHGVSAMSGSLGT